MKREKKILHLVLKRKYFERIYNKSKRVEYRDFTSYWQRRLEGKHFTHRHVNIWPRPWQQPRPRFWAATGDPVTAAEVGRRGMINALVLRGADETRRACTSEN